MIRSGLKWSRKCCLDGWIRLPEQRQKHNNYEKIRGRIFKLFSITVYHNKTL